MSNQNPITQIEAVGVLEAFDYSIDFSPNERMKVIYAPNGCGKTNLLRAISYLLDPTIESLQSLVEVPVRQLHITFSDGNYTVLRREEAFKGSYALEASSEVGARHLSVDPAEFSGSFARRNWRERDTYTEYAEAVTAYSTGANMIADDRLAPMVDDRDRPAARRPGTYPMERRRQVGVVERLLEEVELTLTQNAFAGMSGEKGASGVYAQITRATLGGDRSNLKAVNAREQLTHQMQRVLTLGQGYEQYGLLSLRQVRDVLEQVEAARANDRNLPTLYTILRPYLESLEAQVDALKPAQSLIHTFVSSVNEYLDRKSLEFSTGFGIQLKDRQGRLLAAESLSSGERHLLLLLSSAVLANSSSPFMIIDEPELSLGLDWQRNLLASLLECSRPGGVQYLIASHSVQIMNDLTDELIVAPTENGL